MSQLHEVLLAFIVIQFGTTKCMECNNGWVHFDNSCYWFARDSASSYTEAQHYCRQKNSELVTVDSNRENLFLKDIMHALKAEDHWMGYTDEKIEGLWQWDRTDETGTFTDWYPGEPNGHNVESCAGFYHSRDYRWNDFPCDFLIEPLCEITSDDAQIVG